MITLECNYSKTIGLPGYSNHQFTVSLKTELADTSHLQAESSRIYKLLQNSVDGSISEPGYVPGTNGNGHHAPLPDNDEWKCSVKQRDLILKITDEHRLDKNKVEQRVNDRFGKGVKSLNKLEASGLIEELLEQTGQSKPRNARFGRNAGG
jgi:hypothetical protein